MPAKSKIRENFSLLTILIIPVAIAVNFIGGSLALALKLPLYLDSIGTFLVAMLAGPLVGAITGFLSLLFVSATDPTSLPWAVLATVVGAMTGWLSKMRMFTSVWRIAVSILTIILTSVAAVVTIRLVVFGGYTTSGSSVIAATLVAAGIPIIPAQAISSLAAETPDKILSVVLALIVIRSMSSRYLIKFPLGKFFLEQDRQHSGDRQTPTQESELESHGGLEALPGASDYGSYNRWRGSRLAEDMTGANRD